MQMGIVFSSEKTNKHILGVKPLLHTHTQTERERERDEHQRERSSFES